SAVSQTMVASYREFLEKLRTIGTQICVEDPAASYTYAQLLSEIESWRSRFVELRISPGVVVGLCADYSLSATASLLALLARGTVVAMIPRESDVSRYLIDAQVSLLLKFNSDGGYAWSEVSHIADHPILKQLRADGDSGVIIFTSGSTGRPKAAV